MRGVFFSRIYVADLRRDSIFAYFGKRGVRHGGEDEGLSIAVHANNEGLPVVIIGNGRGERMMMKRSGKCNFPFVWRVFGRERLGWDGPSHVARRSQPEPLGKHINHT